MSKSVSVLGGAVFEPKSFGLKVQRWLEENSVAMDCLFQIEPINERRYEFGLFVAFKMRGDFEFWARLYFSRIFVFK